MTPKNPSNLDSSSWRKTGSNTTVKSTPTSKDITESMQKQMESLRKKLERIGEELEKLKVQLDRHTRSNKIKALGQAAS